MPDEKQALEPGGARRQAGLDDELRQLEHDLNGVLNQLTLQVELLDAPPGAGADEAGRARVIANLRRSLRDLREIVRTRVPAVGSGIGSGAIPV